MTAEQEVMNTLGDELLVLTTELADGIIGAASVLSKLIALSARDCLVFLNSAKALNLKGSRLWVLYKDVCKEEISPVALLLAAHHENILTKDQIDPYIDQLMERRDRELAHEMHTNVIIPTTLAMMAISIKRATEKEAPEAGV